MYVRKFEADTLDEALQEIKRELGPDAIILKTVTNKGIKGAFKRKKIEITAAISEKSYVKKSRVDHVLDQEHKEQFYQTSASQISNMIDNYSDNREPAAPESSQAGGYGSLGLNRAVKTTKTVEAPVHKKPEPRPMPAAQPFHSSLDDFLGAGREEQPEPVAERPRPRQVLKEDPDQPRVEQNQFERAIESRAPKWEDYEAQKDRIAELEKQIYHLNQTVERVEQKEPVGLFQLRTVLRGISINEIFIQNVMKKAMFEIDRESLENPDLVFEFCLREMLEIIQTKMPTFSSADHRGVITVLVSEDSVGQSSMSRKLAALEETSRLVRYPAKGKVFTEEMLGIDVVEAENLSEIVSYCRQAVEKGQHTFVDLRIDRSNMNEAKSFIDGLRRSFEDVEVLVCLSAIHSELYNRRVLATYGDLSEGIVVTHLDQCLEYGALFNVVTDRVNLPLVFYGTGPTVPDDLEAASGERLIAGMFKLS